jgi:Sec-independent protein translocase protein TatA
MWSWIVIGLLYVLVFGGFRILGGLESAMEALRDWGHAAAAGSHPPVSSS